jgi:hypothetical protein
MSIFLLPALYVSVARATDEPPGLDTEVRE